MHSFLDCCLCYIFSNSSSNQSCITQYTCKLGSKFYIYLIQNILFCKPFHNLFDPKKHAWIFGVFFVVALHTVEKKQMLGCAFFCMRGTNLFCYLCDLYHQFMVFLYQRNLCVMAERKIFYDIWERNKSFNFIYG